MSAALKPAPHSLQKKQSLSVVIPKFDCKTDLNMIKRTYFFELSIRRTTSAAHFAMSNSRIILPTVLTMGNGVSEENKRLSKTVTMDIPGENLGFVTNSNATRQKL